MCMCDDRLGLGKKDDGGGGGGERRRGRKKEELAVWWALGGKCRQKGILADCAFFCVETSVIWHVYFRWHMMGLAVRCVWWRTRVS